MAKFTATGPVSSSQYLPFDLGPAASTPGSKSATFLNPLSRDPVCIRNRVDARSGYFLSGDVTRSSPVLNRKRQSKVEISGALRRMLCCQYSQRSPRYYIESEYVSDSCGRSNSIWIRTEFECGRRKFWIRKEKVPDWKNIRIRVDGALGSVPPMFEH